MAEGLQLRVEISDDEATTPLLSSTSCSSSITTFVHTANSALHTPSVTVTPPQPDPTSSTGEPPTPSPSHAGLSPSSSPPHACRTPPPSPSPTRRTPPPSPSPTRRTPPPSPSQTLTTPPLSPSHPHRASTPPLRFSCTASTTTSQAAMPPCNTSATPTLCISSHESPLSVVCVPSLSYTAVMSSVSSNMSSPPLIATTSLTQPLLSSPSILASALPLPLALHQTLIPLVVPSIPSLAPTPPPPPPTPPPTPLLVPAPSSTAPIIYLRQNTPEASPGATPPTTPTVPLMDQSASRPSILQTTFTPANAYLPNTSYHHHLTPNNYDTAFPPPTTSTADRSDSLDLPDTDIGEDDGDDEEASQSGGCAAGLSRRVTHRPSLLIPAPEKHQRRASLLSTLSVSSSTGRRPSLASLLSVTPSLAARRFSFNIGSQSRSDQMVSLSFKSLESYISEDNLTGLQAFLASRSVVIDDRDENGATALIFAASKGKPDFCNELILHGADVNAEDNDQWSPVITAAKEGHGETLATLLDHGANIHHKDMGGWTALMWACYKGHTALAKVLLARGADPNTQGQHHMTSLVWAAGRGHTEIVHDLLEHGAKVNIGDKFGTTPLIWACRKGYYEIAEALLQHGANVDASGMYSWTPLLMATRGNFVDLVHLLLEHRPNLNALDKDGGTALTIACKEGYTEIANALLSGGAYVNMQDRNRDTNLIYAARGGHRAVVEALLKKYCDVDMVGREKKTALYWAVEKGHTAVVKVLLSANPDLEHTTKDGDTCLLRAVRNKNSEVVQLLVDKKARVSVIDKKGDTALHIAMRGRSKRIVEILLRNPKNSQLLYRPNRAGETPYNIDLSNQKTILGQIFGARRLNTNEDNENMLGYDLYSSSMADILSEPSLSMPISVGLYAKWGSGKSFLIRKLKEEMGSFARQWVEPLFQFSPLVLLLVVHLSLLLGLIIAVPTFSWVVGLATGGGVFLFCTLILVAIWHGSRRYDLHMWYRWSVSLEKHMAAFKLVLQVIFCSPPGAQWKEWKDGVQARPLKFIFAEGAKPSSTAAGENSVVQMLGSLFDMVEREYGMFATRFYRAFRPKAQVSSSPWKYRRLCGIPYIVIFFVTLICLLIVGVIAGLFGFHAETPFNEEEEEMSLQAIDNSKSDDDDDKNDEDDDISGESSEEIEYIDIRPYHGQLMNPLLITLGVLVAVVVVANLHTLARMVVSLMFSHRRHLLRAVAKLDTIKAEGYLLTLKSEVDLMVDMVKCLDAFTSQQTRLVVVVDGLDSCEQEKVLSVLDAVHTLFTDNSAPFIILLAIDPHIITRAIELHVHRVFNESSISGHDYLRNIVHLPFYLQNSGLRKVKQAQQAAERIKCRSQNTWLEVETDSVSIATTSAMGGISHIPLNRCLSTESGFSFTIPANRRLSSESGLSSSQNLRRNNSKSSRRNLKPSDSIASSIGSNLNRVGGAQDLTKVLLTDDYFSDINPRSMRRLMNVVYITGRLLKAFHIDFNWYHLASWINITEQWPYRASWLILYYEANEDTLEEKTSLKDLYEKIKNQVPVSKDMEPLLEMDKEEKKFEIFLSMHKNSLHISDLKIFLPFTINLDPFIRKVIKEDQPQFEDHGPHFTANAANPWTFQQYDAQSKSSSTGRRPPQRGTNKSSTASLPPMNPMLWGYGPPFMPSMQSAPSVDFNSVPVTVNPIISSGHASLPPEAVDKKLSSLTIESLFEIFSKVEGVSATMLPSYKDRFVEHNINGKVLLHCDLDDLKKVLNMNFGDWELFRVLILGMRDREADDDFISKNVRFADPHMQQHGGHSVEDVPDDSGEPSSLTSNPSSMDGSLIRRGSSRASSTYSSNKDREDSHNSVRKMTKQNLLAKQESPRKTSLSSDGGVAELSEESNTHYTQKDQVNPNLIIPKIVIEQVTMEEQLIFGALQTLNEEACEDVQEEREKGDQPVPPTHLSTIPSGESIVGDGLVAGSEEMDVVYLQSSPLVSHRVISPSVSDVESTAPSLSSSFSPYKSNNVSLSRASSLRCSSTSTSPKHSSVDKPPSVTLRNDKGIKVLEHKDTSPIRRISLSNSSSPLRRDRPQSLNLGRGYHDQTASSPATPQADQLPNDEIPLASLPDLPEAVAGMKHVSLAEQFSSTSLEKLRRLKHKLHRALGSHDSSIRDPSDDAETSPLVLASPPLSSATPTCPSSVHTPDVEDSHPLNHCPDGYSRSITPLLRQDAIEASPTSLITSKPSSVDRETPV